MKTLIRTIPAVFNVCCLFGLLFFVYAVLGMNLFGEQPLKTDFELGNVLVESSISEEKNLFTDFASSLLILFQCVTGDDWNR